MVAVSLRRPYCLSYTDVYFHFLPLESVPLTVTVRLLPSADTTIRPVVVTLLFFLLVSSVVRSLIVLYARVSAFESPTRG